MAEGINIAGEYSLELAEIIPVDGVPAPITGHVVQITIYEDIQNPFLSGNISFNDNTNLKDILPLIGQEMLKLKIKTPSVPGRPDEIIESLFYMHDLVNSVDINANNRLHNYKFISVEAIVSARTQICRPMRGTISSIVASIIRNDLKSKKDIYVEPSVGLYKKIATEISPTKFITDIMAEAVSEKYSSPSYMFFETLEGFHFRSLESLYSESIIQKFTSSSEGGYSPKKHGFSNVLEELSQIRKLTLHNNAADSLENSGTGSYASELITHDIFNKKISHGNNYHYFNSFDKEKHINSFHGKKQAPIHSKVAVDDNESTVADFPSMTYLLPISFSDDAKKIDAHYTDVLGNSENFTGYNPASWLTKRTSLMNNYDGIATEMIVDGNTILRAGHMVEINIPPSALTKQKDKTKPDRFHNGAFLVRNIMHIFTFKSSNGSHMMDMTCVKDCLEEPIDYINKDPEPKVFGTNKEKPKTIPV